MAQNDVQHNERGEVRAAGGVVWRRSPAGVLEVLVVHRPRYDDWSLPKGKAEPGETDESCALREVAEETGLHCKLGPELPSTTYLDRRGRPKRARYWAMAPVGGSFVPSGEVDEVRWVPVEAGAAVLSYERDRDVVTALPATLRATGGGPVLLVRHAEAMARWAWDGPDRLRPLTDRGVVQAGALVQQLRPYPVRRVLTSPAVRCVQTVEPVATARGLVVEHAPELAEGMGAAAAGLARSCLEGGALLCSHGDVLGDLLHALDGGSLGLGPDPDFAKGATWALVGEAGAFTAARYLPPPA